jgi:dCTP deaminase
MILNDAQIRKLALEKGMIAPFVDYSDPKPEGVISYGLTSFGYDVRLGRKFAEALCLDRLANIPVGLDEVSPKNPQSVHAAFFKHETNFKVLPPGSLFLAETMETFKMPRDVLAVCVGKSTWARCGLLVNVTPLEPEWEGVLTLEITNMSPNPVRVYIGEGIAQLNFLQGEPCERSYADKKGKYQNQVGVTLPR